MGGLLAALVAALVPLVWARYRRRHREAASAATVEAYAVDDPADPRLHEALALYHRERRIPADEKNAMDDMVRWVREERDKGSLARLFCRDDLIVSVVSGAATGLLHLTHYPWQRMAFVSYVVVQRAKTLEPSAQALVDRVGLTLRCRRPRCRIVIAEADDPRTAPSSRERATRNARLRLFDKLARTQGAPMRVLDVPFMQPCLDADGNGCEKPLLLLVFFVRRTRVPRAMGNGEADRVVRFVYESVYGDSFLNDERATAHYARYLEQLRKRVLRGVGDRARLLEVATLLTG